MPRLTDEDRLKQLQQRRDQLNAQLAALEARNRQADKKRDDRRKILLGALVLADLQQRPELRAYLRERLPNFLTRPEDRKLFTDLFPPEDVPATNASPGGDVA